MTGGTERRREGGKEGKEGGREDGRKKETKAELQNGVHFGHVTFKELQVPSNWQMSVSKCGKDRAVYRF